MTTLQSISLLPQYSASEAVNKAAQSMHNTLPSRRFLSSIFFIRTVILLAIVITLPSLWAQTSAQVGQWSPVMTWPFKAVHTHVLPTGKVMFWDSFDLGDNARMWDPTTNVFTTLSKSGVNIFCTGHSLLPDGRLLITGGHIANFVGLRDALTFDPFDNSWARLPDMNAPRWYPTNTTLANGDVLVVSGQIDTTSGMNVLPQVYQLASGTWRDLTNAQLALPFYPFMYVAPNGKVFMAGPDQVTRYLDTSGTGAWNTLASTNYGPRNWGSSVMYDDGKIIILGGTLCGPYAACGPTATTEIIDLKSANPQWTYAASMANARKHQNATLLPDGKVLVTGGSRGDEQTNDNSVDPAYASEVWDPATNTWRTLASITVYRGYHATAALLPDGRVLSAGGENGGATAEIFSPPYLFNGARPTITSAPPYIEYGRSFFVATPDAANIAKVNLIYLSSVTHAFNATQRICRLAFTQASGGLNVTAASDPNLAPPGYYMMFLLNAAGVPSIAKILRLDNIPTTTPPAPTNLIAAATGTQINLTWTDNASNETGFKIERSPDGSAATFVQIAAVGANVTTYPNTGLTTGATYYYRVRSVNAAGNSAYSNTASATVPAPAAPTALNATAASSTQINLSWTDNSTNETGFKIERSPDGAPATFAQIATVGVNVTTYSNTGQSPNTTYYYRVRATNAVSDSAYSNISNATTSAPVAPTALNATAASSTQINLTWIDNAGGETGFKIERSPDGLPATFAQIATVGANVTSFPNTGLTATTTYFYRIRATNAVGDSAYSNTSSATTSSAGGSQAPTAPTGLAATAFSGTQINLAWIDNATNETGFKVERSVDGVTFTQIATVGTNVITYANTGLLGGTKYYYRVRGTNATGDSSFSNTANATTPFVVGVQGPAAPTNLVAIPESKTITLTWTDVAGDETGFKIERSPDGAATTFAQIATVAANITTYSDSDLPPQTTYHYRVRSTNATGDSPFSNTVSATTPVAVVAQRPLAPTNRVASSESKKEIIFTWTDRADNETGFKVERSPDGSATSFEQIGVVGANVTVYSDDHDLSRETTYYYRVYSTNAEGDSNKAFGRTAVARKRRGESPCKYVI